MPKTKDYKKLAEKLEKDIAILKAQVKASYDKGFEAAYAEMDKMEALYEKHMVKAEKEFYKKMSQISAKKKTAPKKNVTKKSTSKTKTAKTEKSKTTAKRSSRPARKKG